MAKDMAKFLVIITTIIMVIKGIAAENHTVQWVLPLTPDYYTLWAGNQSFAVGDTLVFDFPTQAHTVAEVTKQGFDQCLSGNSEVHINGPTTITLDKPGSYYFICTVGRHCARGAMKLTITVPSGGHLAGSPAISPEKATEKGSSAPPFASTAFGVSLVALVAALTL